MKKLLSLILATIIFLFLSAPALAMESEFVIDAYGVLTDYNGPGGNVVIPSGVTAIGVYAFAWCHDLSSVTIPSSVESIGEDAFRECENLQSVTIQEGLKKIEDYAFIYCDRLSSVKLPNSLEEIGADAFKDCFSLSDVTIPSNVKKIGEFAFSGCDGLKNITIPVGVKSINYCTFAWCDSLISVTIPNSVTRIWESAFEDCSSLTNVAIPDSVTRIDRNAFRGCSSLESVTIPANVASLGTGAFGDCSSLTSLQVANGNHYFKSADNVLFNRDGTELLCCPAGKTGHYEVPAGTAVICESAFSGCNKLSGVTLPDSVNRVDESAFEGCDELTDATIPSSVTSFGRDAFYGTPWQERFGAFPVVNGVLLKYQGTEKDVVIPSSVNCIGEYAFQFAIITSVLIPDSVNKIEKGAFSFCWSLTSLTIPASVTSIDGNPVDSCSSFSDFYISSDNPNFKTVDRVLFSKSGDVLVSCPATWEGPYIIPDSVTKIGAYAFSGCYGITDITIPPNVTNIDEGAFIDCFGLHSVEIPKEMTRIGDSTFSGCALGNVSIPNGVTSIGDRAFQACDGLSSVTIPASVKDIGFCAFDVANGSWDIYYGGSEAQWNAINVEYGNEPFARATIHFNSSSGEKNLLDQHMEGPSTEPNNELAKIAAQLSVKAYDPDSVKGYLTWDLGFRDEDVYENNYGMGSLAFVIAEKEYTGADSDGNTGLLVIVARGSSTWHEYYMDAATSANDTLPGYSQYPIYDIVKDFHNAIAEGLKQYSFNFDKHKILITGHSLGGAAANLVAANFTDKYGKDDIYCYTFGAIDSIKSNGTVSEGFENIHNITNFYDTFGPNGTGWRGFTAAGNTRYGKFGHIDLFYRDVQNGANDNTKNHDMDTYIWALENNVVEYEHKDNQRIESRSMISVTVNDSVVSWTDAMPFINSDNRTMVPLRAVAEALGLTVSWDGAKREAIFTDGTRTIYFPIGSSVARTGDGSTVQMDTAAVIVNSRTFAPIRYLAEYFGCDVDWDGATRTVLIQKPRTEVELRAMIPDDQLIQLWVYDDFNGDGGKEAFALTLSNSSREIIRDDAHSFDGVYFVDGRGARQVLSGSTSLYSAGGSLFYESEDGYRRDWAGRSFFVVDNGAGGSGYSTLLFGMKGGEPYELELSRNIQGFIEKDGKLYTTGNDFSQGYHTRPVGELLFDAEREEFYIGKRVADDSFAFFS